MARSTKLGEAEQLAQLCCERLGAFTRAGRRLHDELGPLLGAAGLKLQLLKMDVPEAAQAANETLEMLDSAFDQIRALSQEMLSSPALRAGLGSALARLAEEHAEVELTNRSAVRLEPEIAAAVYEVVTSVVAVALRSKAKTIRISISGNTSLSVRISDDGRAMGRRRELAVQARLAASNRVRVEFATKDGRIVLIKYAVRRSPRG